MIYSKLYILTELNVYGVKIISIDRLMLDLSKTYTYSTISSTNVEMQSYSTEIKMSLVYCCTFMMLRIWLGPIFDILSIWMGWVFEIWVEHSYHHDFPYPAHPWSFRYLNDNNVLSRRPLSWWYPASQEWQSRHVLFTKLSGTQNRLITCVLILSWGWD